MKRKSGFQLRELIVVVVITSIITSITTGVIMYNNSRITNHVSGMDLSQDESLKEFLRVYASLIGDYYGDIDRTAMLEAAMKAMFDYLGEDYSNYLDPNQTNALAEKLQGEYQGIGVQIISDNIIYKVFSDSPAEKTGLQVNDQIIRVNDVDVTSLRSSEVAGLIQSHMDEELFLDILREGQEMRFQLHAETLLLPAINYQVVHGSSHEIGYLAISTFSNSVYQQVQDALMKMEQENIDSLIIDLRDNTGGYLSQATDISNLFLEKNKIIYSLQDKNDTVAYRDTTDEKRSYPIVVVVNDSTASASEILAAALKDSYGAVIVGEVTFGKGRVQQTRSLEDGSMIKYTTAKWLRPNGDCIDGVGIFPDIPVEIMMPVEGEEVIDTQLQKAISILDEK